MKGMEREKRMDARALWGAEFIGSGVGRCRKAVGKEIGAKASTEQNQTRKTEIAVQ